MAVVARDIVSLMSLCPALRQLVPKHRRSTFLQPPAQERSRHVMHPGVAPLATGDCQTDGPAETLQAGRSMIVGVPHTYRTRTAWGE